MIILFFILLLLLEDLLFPALLGSNLFMITPIFILGLVIDSRNYKKLILQVIIFTMVAEFFNGMATGSVLFPISLTALLYIWTNKYINFTDGFRDNISLSGVFIGTLFLSLLGYIYSFLFIFIQTSYNISLTWNNFNSFFTGSLLSVLGWSMAITILFKYVFKTK